LTIYQADEWTAAQPNARAWCPRESVSLSRLHNPSVLLVCSQIIGEAQAEVASTVSHIISWNGDASHTGKKLIIWTASLSLPDT